MEKMKSSRQNGTCFGGAGVSPSPYFTIALSRSLVSLLLNQQKRVEEIHAMKSNNIIPFIVQNTFIPVTGNARPSDYSKRLHKVNPPASNLDTLVETLHVGPSK